MEKEYKPTARQNMASEGVLNEQYTLDSWFVKIKPAYGIDRVNFSFVEKGKNGKGFNVYVNIDTFYNWMEDVQNFRLYKIIEAEKKENSKYPKQSTFITGTTGEKSVGFAPSTIKTAFVVINGTYKSDSGNQYACVPVDYDWLRTTARWFFLTSKSYYEEMAETTVKSSTAYRNNLGEDDEAAPATETSGTKEKQNSKQEQTTKPSQTQQPQKKKPVDSTKPGDRSDAKAAANPAGENPLKAKAETKTMNADSNSYVIKADERGNYRMEILDEQGKPFSLILPFSVIKNDVGNELFSKFMSACEASKKAKNHSHFIMKYSEGSYNNKSVLVFRGFVQ